jgi:4-hydroxybenzoate polyprenyltransferase
VSPLTSIHTAFEKQKWSFYLQLLMFVLSLASIFLAYFNEWSFVNYLFLFGAVMSVFYFFRIIIVLKIAKNKSVNE